MGFSLNKNKGPISEINVTPFVDVMLVLLIIFMIAAPLMLNGIKLTLPKTKENNTINLTTDQVVLSFTKAGDYYIGKQKVLHSEIIPEVKRLFSKNKTEVLFLRADYSLRYGKVAQLMSFLKQAGIITIALVTETEE
ncbi:MAG: biopolymer transporter ExbD [Bdellovibrionales bacterium]|jgi:biopolymer transport protein TolR|nr:biopolymer transporter ExbD [Bdellovibrionales bacterium]